MVVKKVMSYILCLENWENFVCFKSLVAAKFNILLQFQCVMNFSFQLFHYVPTQATLMTHLEHDICGSFQYHALPSSDCSSFLCERLRGISGSG